MNIEVTQNIPGGYVLKPRCIQHSNIAAAPPHVREIWDWILLNANYKDHGKIKRGQLLTTYRDIKEGLAWYVGYRKETYKKHQCETAMKILTRENMITTAKTTRGLIITVLNYDKYQTPGNYENYTGNEPSATGKLQPSATIRKEGKKRKEEDITASNDAVCADPGEMYRSKRGRTLKGHVLTDFNLFWEAFGYKKGKAEAADAWLDVYTMEMMPAIIEGAREEAKRRPEQIKKGRTPKMAQGWLSGRRWEDENLCEVVEEEDDGWI